MANSELGAGTRTSPLKPHRKLGAESASFLMMGTELATLGVEAQMIMASASR